MPTAVNFIISPILVEIPIFPIVTKVVIGKSRRTILQLLITSLSITTAYAPESEARTAGPIPFPNPAPLEYEVIVI